MEITKTESQRDKLNRLFKEYGLLTEDVHKHQHYTIIRRTGIEKIAAAAGIRLTYEVCQAQADYAAVKATAKKGKGPALVTVETFGSACPTTSQNKYFLEMAEKRAKSRAVLMISDLYQEGVFGEDEADAFDRRHNAQPEAARPSQPAAPGPTPPASPTPTVPAAVDASTGEVMAKAQVLDLLRSAESHAQLEAFWKEDVKGVWELDVDVLSVAKEVRARLNAELQATA